MSIVLYSNPVQTYIWYYRGVNLMDIAYTPGAISEKGTLDIDCCGCCCMKSRAVCCGTSKPLFDMENGSSLIQNGILTKQEYDETMMEFTYALRRRMCCFPCYCVSSLFYPIPGPNCICMCLQRWESNCIIDSFKSTLKDMNAKHRNKQIAWEVQYEKAQVACYGCCMPFNYWNLKAVATPPLARAPVMIANPIIQQKQQSDQAPAVSRKSLGESLKELGELRNQGVLTEEEFVSAKEKLLK